ncbi:MAG: ImmA/IrrE family metallo-endopeptidase [Magnetococcales bacterium]|nr:ImmA/IrrE family metallo-endopeptidase [Magnetococcales bacterium]
MPSMNRDNNRSDLGKGDAFPFAHILDPVDILCELDFPETFTLRTAEDNLYLLHYLPSDEETDSVHRFLAFGVTPDSIERLKSDRQTLHQLILESSGFYYLEADEYGRIHRSQWSERPLAPEHLPRKHAMLPNRWGTIRRQDGLILQVKWPDDGTQSHGHLLVWLNDTLLWGQDPQDPSRLQPVAVDWIELLRYLGENWTALCLKEESPTFDLAEAIPQTPLPSLTLLRRGDNLLLSAGDSLSWTMTFTSGLDLLDQLGDWIRDNFTKMREDDRTRSIVERWRKRRDNLPPEQAWELASGGCPSSSLDANLLTFIRKHPCPPHQPSKQNPWAGLAMAARMVKGESLSPEALQNLLRRIHQASTSGPKANPLLQRYKRNLVKVLLPNQAPHQQGEFAANWLRRELGNPTGPVDLKKLFSQQLDIETTEYLSESRFDAIAVWGGSRRPVIFLNPNGSRHPDGLQVTLAHELAHILLDSEGSRPVGDFRLQDMPTPPDQSVEARANAFAAEFLFPTHVATSYVISFKASPKETMKAISDRFGVSHETAAWKLLHTGQVEWKEVFKHFKSKNSSYKSIIDRM